MKKALLAIGILTCLNLFSQDFEIGAMSTIQTPLLIMNYNGNLTITDSIFVIDDGKDVYEYSVVTKTNGMLMGT